jgi:hypothetical protein
MTRLLTCALVAAALVAGCGGGAPTNHGSPSPVATSAPEVDSTSSPDPVDTTDSDPVDTTDSDPVDTTDSDPADTSRLDDSDAPDEDAGSESDAGRWVDERQGSVIDDVTRTTWTQSTDGRGEVATSVPRGGAVGIHLSATPARDGGSVVEM